MNGTLVFIDAGFISKLKKYFGNGNYLKTDLIKLSNNLSKKHNLDCVKIFYYTAPPFQSGRPTKEESQRFRRYRKFKARLSKYPNIIIREGRCQRLKIDGNFKYGQKAVDILLTMDLTNVPINYLDVKQIILMTTDSDFVPIMENLKQQKIKTILYTYYDRKRDTNFSRSNELIKSVSRYVQLTKQDFEDATLK